MSKRKKTASTGESTPVRTSRVNLRNLGILSVLIVVLVGVVVTIQVLSAQRIRSSALAQARANFENRQIDLALRHLDRFLFDHPDDLEAIELKTEILSKSATSGERVLQAAQAHDLLIRIDPNGKDRLTTRRRLIELYLTYGELVRSLSDELNDAQIEANESRYLAAIQTAKDLIEYKDPKTGIENGKIDSSAHRLKAMAHMARVPGLIVKKPEDSETLREAKIELDLALKIDPTDYLASEKLAELYLTHLKDPATAELTLDRMLESLKDKKFSNETEAKNGVLNVRLSRFLAFYRTKNFKRAQEELQAAIEVAPVDKPEILLDIRTSAAGLALQMDDVKECRRQIAAIPANLQRDNLRVRFLKGALEFAERHPEEAIDEWRKGLSLVGGGDIDLTWRLASNLIQFNRLVEARPLVDQFLRLAKPNDPLGLYLEGMYQEKAGHINKAIELMSKASTMVPAAFKSDILMSLGHCFEMIGNEDRAMYSYKQAANLGGTSTGPRRAMARLYFATNPARAMEELENANATLKASGRSKGDPNLLIDLIRLKLDKQMRLAPAARNFSEVSKLIDEARALAPENPAIQALLATYQSQDNKLDQAIKTLEDTVKGSNRKRVDSWLAWAEALEVIGRPNDALRVLDQGMTPDAAEDHASLRAAKARILLKLGLGSQAEEVLTKNLENFPKPELPDLTKALGDLLQEMGDRPAAREAYKKWAELSPESPFPALKLLSIAQLDGDEEAAKAGLDVLAKLGRNDEPYGLAARALQLLRVDPTKLGPPPPERLNQAEDLVLSLKRLAPEFPVLHMIEGMLFEYRADPQDPKKWRESMTKAGEAYRKSIKIGAASPALPKLIEIYMKLQDDNNLNLLKIEYDDGTQRQKTEISMEFDRLTTLIAMKLGYMEKAENILKKMREGRPDNSEIGFANARLLESRGKFQEAETALQDLLRAKPQDENAWLEMIRFQAERRSAAEVARTIEQARQKFTGDRPELFLAKCYWRGNDIRGAIGQYQKAVEARPEDLMTLRSLVDFREATGQGDQVEPVLRKILKLDGTSTWAARHLAVVLTSRSDPSSWNEAWKLVEPGAPSAGNSPEDRLIRAIVLARSADSTKRLEAIAAYESLANDLPLSSVVGLTARLRLAKEMLAFDRPAEAWKYIERVTDDLSKSNLEAIVVGIEALSRMGRADDAERRLTRLTGLRPNGTLLGFSRAWVLFAHGKADESALALMSTYEKVESEPDGEFVGNKCLELLIKFNNLDAALSLARRMTDRWPKEVRNLARVQMLRKEYDDTLNSCRVALEQGLALESIQIATSAAVAQTKNKAFLKKVEELGVQARDKAPTNPFVLICLATVYHLLGEYDRELAFYRMAIELKPDNLQFLNNMAWTLSEGTAPDKEEPKKEAMRRIEELITREGPLPQYLDTRGIINLRLKNYDKAIDDLEKSVKGDPNAATYFHLARAYYKANKMEESRRCRDIAISKGFDVESLDATDRVDVKEVMGKS